LERGQRGDAKPQEETVHDQRVRRALTLAIGHWHGAPALSKIAIVKTIGGVRCICYSNSRNYAQFLSRSAISRDLGARPGLSPCRSRCLGRGAVEPARERILTRARQSCMSSRRDNPENVALFFATY
jgi:hypothetical protein